MRLRPADGDAVSQPHLQESARVCRACHMPLWIVPHRQDCQVAAVEAELRELRLAARTLIGMYMADLDIGDCVARLEDLTGGQQNGS